MLGNVQLLVPLLPQLLLSAAVSVERLRMLNVVEIARMNGIVLKNVRRNSGSIIRLYARVLLLVVSANRPKMLNVVAIARVQDTVQKNVRGYTGDIIRWYARK